MTKRMNFTHIASFFFSQYASITSKKKYCTARKLHPFGFFDEEIFIVAKKRAKEGLRLPSEFDAATVKIYHQKSYFAQHYSA